MIGVVQQIYIAFPHAIAKGIAHRLHREGHGADMHRDVIRLRHQRLCYRRHRHHLNLYLLLLMRQHCFRFHQHRQLMNRQHHQSSRHRHRHHT